MLQKKVNLFGLEIDDISKNRAWELATLSLKGGDKRIFFTPNLEMLEKVRKDEETRRILNSAQVLLPDGIGVLLVSRLLRTPIENKVAGIDFGKGLIALAEREGASIFLLGGAQGVAKKAAKNLLKRHKNLKISGIHNGYFENEDEIIRKIQKSNPDILIVCMGFSRQEQFVFKHKQELSNIKVITCLGGALDVWSGRKMRAPSVVRKIHLEWLWRVVGEPSRIGRFVSSLPALFYALRN